MADQENQTLKWRFDINVLRLLGRELITDRITAVYELVKNAYDANAIETTVEFQEVSTRNLYSKIIIQDDGFGMTFEDIRDKWMVVGTDSKRKENFSPEPFIRRYVGEKGIGRFATDKLGGRLIIRTKKSGESAWLNVEIDWRTYKSKLEETKSESVKLALIALDGQHPISENDEPLVLPAEEKNDAITLFTDKENKYWHDEADDLSTQGTQLIMTDIHEEWSDKDIERLNRELSKFVSPFYPHKTSFKIFIISNGQKEEVKSAIVDLASHVVEVGFGTDENSEKYQEEARFDEAKGRTYNKKIYGVPTFGFVKMKLYFFNKDAKAKYNRAFPNKEDRIDGIKIYRDGIITTPFAEYEDDPMRRRDILGIDKRLWQDTFTRIGSREVLGYVEITKDGNPQIIDATNRQDFVHTPEYRDLKRFILEQLDVFSKVKIFEVKQKRILNEVGFKEAIKDLSATKKLVVEIEKKNPALFQELAPIKTQLETAIVTSEKNLKEQKKMHEEFLRKENIYLSLMSLQEYAVLVAHAVRTIVGKVLRMAEFFSDEFPNDKYADQFKLYAGRIYEEMKKLNRVTDFMLSYAGSNLEFEDINLKILIENLFDTYDFEFEKEGIETLIEVEGNIILFANKKFFEEIIQNLISNSIKALKGQEYKKIKFSGWAEDDHCIFYFSDNGIGVPSDKRERVFELYYTETADRGGAGVGLFIVHTRIESLKGKIEIVDSELKPTGTTFKITLPFKKN